MPRRTKIVATLGPSTDAPNVLESMIRLGVDVVRVNFSHGRPEDHKRRAEAARRCAENCGRVVAVLADLQGPKIRIERFLNEKISLTEGDTFVLDAEHDSAAGTAEIVGVTYKKLPQDVHIGDTLLLDDGNIRLLVERIVGTRVECRVMVGGDLSNNKGINRLGGGLSAAVLTDKDKVDLKLAAEIDADYIAISFPRSAADVNEVRELLRAGNGRGCIIAKIERAEALEAIEEIITAADAVMIARGDLGVEIGDAELPGVQKRIIKLARSMDRVVITATQMMQSMVHSRIPTRAEVFDVANAVMDGTDAVMLSAETASGQFPAQAVEAMDRICIGAERQRATMTSDHRIDMVFRRGDEAIAMATMYTANHLNVKAIAALTESGSTPLWMSRISSGIPIYALTKQIDTRRRVTLYRGVYPVTFNSTSTDHATVNKEVIDELIARGAVEDGDLVIITKGDLMGMRGGTNAMKIVRVGDMVVPRTE